MKGRQSKSRDAATTSVLEFPRRRRKDWVGQSYRAGCLTGLEAPRPK